MEIVEVKEKLDLIRKNKELWDIFKYEGYEDEEWGTQDKNEKIRLALIIELQYDHQESDEELIKFLMENEVISRENDSFQGYGDSLKIISYLLANYKKN